jgi:small redox-active disulfide protein 2
MIMLSVKVFGPGCVNCEKLEELANKAVEQIRVQNPDLNARVEKISEPERFLDYGVMTTPGLVVNEKLVSSGKVPTFNQILAWLQEALATV